MKSVTHLNNPLLVIRQLLMKGVFILGASGAGKTTLAAALSAQYVRFFGQNAVLSINLDCANPSPAAHIDLCDLITLEDVMEQYELGPNGALLYAADFLLANISWLYERIEEEVQRRSPGFGVGAKLGSAVGQSNDLMVLFDLPGQVQLYVQSGAMEQVLSALRKRFFPVACVLQLFDATYIYQINDFVAMCLVALASGITFAMPHISLLNKIDLLKNRRPGAGMLEDYLAFGSLEQLAGDLRLGKAPMLQSLERVIDQFSRVSFAPCSVDIPDLLLFLIFHLEKMFGTLETNLYGNRSFGEAMRPFLRDFATSRLLNNLQGQLFQDQQVDWEAEIAAMRSKEPKS